MNISTRKPSFTSQQAGAIKRTSDNYPYLDPAVFQADFAADLPREQAEFESRSQIPTAADVFSTSMAVAAWKTKPSWGIVAGADRIIDPDLECWYYERAGSHTTEIAGASHSVCESRPREVAAVIEAAAHNATS
jgi:pimeloyl-ACP methyl ester carboxylesterase